jgi:glycosyltransferase involved in cell wall biosynthesis
MSLALTVIIPTYNRAHLVTRAVKSAMAQIRPGDEIIVVDDGSTDNTEEVLKPLLSNIRYFRKTNGRAGAARNFALKHTKTPLVAYLDSDDEWLPGKLELQRRLIEVRPDVALCCSDFGEVVNGEIVHFYLKQWYDSPPVWEEILGKGIPYSSLASLPEGIQDLTVYIGNLFSHLVQADYVLTSSAVVNWELAGDSLFFDEDTRYWEDHLAFTRVARKGSVAFLNIETTLQYDHEIRMSRVQELIYIDATILAHDRRWNLDPSYLEAHRDEYLAARDKLHRHKAAYLASLGRAKEARAALREARTAPFRYKVATALPGVIARPLIKILKGAKGSLPRS